MLYKRKYMLVAIYLVSVIYCVYRMYRSYRKRDVDPIYATPGLETLAIMVLAPVLMVVDVSMTWVRLYREADEVRQSREKIY